MRDSVCASLRGLTVQPGFLLKRMSEKQKSAVAHWHDLYSMAENKTDFTWKDFMTGSNGEILQESDLEVWYPGFKCHTLGLNAKKAA